ncbi:hypothetical protein [Vibrio sp. 10N.247.311.51]|uniref:hypothetical protein n=1 Tax=Vibrio sp. 10N.247.311.51 TaxID=3229996 RepID=UPI003553F200
MIPTIVIILVGAIIAFAFDKNRQSKLIRNDSIRRENISQLIDELCGGVKEMLIEGTFKRADERFVASGMFSYLQCDQGKKNRISHKSRVILSNQALIVLEWDFENRWEWSAIEKIEMYSDGFTVYPRNDSILKFKTTSISKPEMEVITMLGMEGCHRGTIENLPIIPTEIKLGA